MRHHLRHHARFYCAALFGLAAWATGRAATRSMRLVLAGDVFFAVYLASTSLLALHSTPDELRRLASYEDEGVAVIFVLTLSAIVLCLGSFFALLAAPARAGGWRLALAIASVPLGWLTLHTIMAFHYAHLFYAAARDGKDRRDAGGLAFPGAQEPSVWDFLYYSFVVGMTAQVSDVEVCTQSMRRSTLVHGITSFFYNTVLLALAVNLAVR